MSWREVSPPLDRELTREEIEQMHKAKEEKIQGVEAKIQTMQDELLVLENELLRWEDRVKEGDEFSNAHMREHVRCPYSQPLVDRLNNMEWKINEVKMNIHYKGKAINDLQFELYTLKNEKARLPRLF